MRHDVIATWNAAGEHRWSARVFRLLLVLRVLWNLSFCVMLFRTPDPQFGTLLDLFSRFALVDGALALAMALGYVVIAPRRMLWVSPATDGVTRLLLATLVRHGPGIPVFPVLLVLYVGLIATYAFLDGALDFAEGMALKHEFGAGGGWFLLASSGAIAMLVGVALFTVDLTAQAVRVLLAVLSATHATALALTVRHIRTALVGRAPPPATGTTAG